MPFTETVLQIAAALGAVALLLVAALAVMLLIAGLIGIITGPSRRKQRAEAKASQTHPVFSGRE